jgi:hypothetical protein
MGAVRCEGEAVVYILLRFLLVSGGGIRDATPIGFGGAHEQ